MAVSVMQRCELKYLMDGRQAMLFARYLEEHMRPDEYGMTTISSLYYDTPDMRLIRASIEKPEFKEKIRLRSYGRAYPDSTVYLELKRKAEGTVYKRRVPTTVVGAERFFAGEDTLGGSGQIKREIAFFRDRYRDLVPACLVMCERTAYFEPDGDLRLTVDSSPRFRTDRLSLTEPADGEPLLPEGWRILEVKVQQAVPLWLSRALSECGIYRTGYSKYGEAYKKAVKKETEEKNETPPAEPLRVVA